MAVSLHETCQQYVARRLSEGWKIVSQRGYHLILSSPDGNVLRPVDLRNDIETFRPNAAGDETNIPGQFPVSDEHWDKVDEATSGGDGDSTYVDSSGTKYNRDLYNLPAPTGSGTINFIKLYCVCRSYTSGAWGKFKPSLKSDTTVTDGTEVELATTTYTTYSQQWNTNPADSAAWEWSDIDTLQIGLKLTGLGTYTARCTQVYVEVDYTPPVGWTGKISGVTNPGKVMGVDVANIAKVKGVA